MAILPVLAIVALLSFFKKPADFCGWVGFAITAAVAVLFFNTSLEVIFRSTISGTIKSFSVSLIVATSLFQMAFLEKTGALKRIIVFIKTLASGNKYVQLLLLNVGFGVLMVSVGATPVSLLPPILTAMGYTTFEAISLPCIGYNSLCTYALLGAPIIVFVDIANGYLTGGAVTLSEVGSVFFIFIPIVSLLIGLIMLWIAGKFDGIKKGFLPCLVLSAVIGVVAYFSNKFDNLVVLTGVFCGTAVIIVMLLYLKLIGGPIIDKSILTKEEVQLEKSLPLWKALLPWAVLIGLIMLLNLPKPLFDLLYRKLLFAVPNISPDGKPIATRFLWNAYTWILVSTLVSIPFLKPSKKVMVDTCKVWLKRAPKPVFSAAIFFVIGEIMTMSGFDTVSKTYVSDSMIKTISDACVNTFGSVYGGVSSFVGIIGGFITGSEASTIAMFGQSSMSAAGSLGFSKTGIIIITAALAFGGGLASVISPAKLQNAAASIDKLGEETKVMKSAFFFALMCGVVTSVFALIFLSFV